MRAGTILVRPIRVLKLQRATAFHAAYWVIFAIAALGALTAAIAFPRRTTQEVEPGAPAPSHGSIVPEPTEQSA